MMKKILYIALLAATATTACRRSEIQHDQQGGALQVEIERQAFDDPDSLSNPASKATETAFEPNDSIGIYVHTAAKLTATGNHTPNLLYATANGTTWTAGGYLSDLLQAGTTYTATGYYPYDRLMIDPTAFVFTVRGNQTTPQAVAQSELMYAAPTAIATPTSAPKLTLSFKHLFTKVTLKFAIPPAIDGAVVAAVDRVDLRGVYRAATVNLSDGTLTKPDNQGDVAMHLVAGDPTLVGSEVTYEGIVIPQTIKKGALLAELSFQTASGARKFTYRPDADEVWVGNQKRNLHLVSVGDLCFTSRLDLTDGLAHADLALKIKAPAGAWTLTSPAAWLTLSTTAGGTYGASVSGTSTGAEQTIYVSATANTAASGVSWLPRSGVLTLTSGVLKTSYTATQNFYRFGMGAAAFDALAGQSTLAVVPFVSNQEWKATGSGDWLKTSPSAEFGAGEPKQEYTGGGSVGTNELFVHIDANNTAVARTGTVTFTPATAGGTASVTTIRQPVALCELTPKAVGVSKYVSTATPLFTVTVPRGVRWKLTSVVSGGVSDMNLSLVPAVGAEQIGTGEPQQVVGSYTELVGDAVRYSDVAVAWASYGADQQATVRVTQNLEAILIGNTWWATGNLVATGARGAATKGGCAIGAPSDGGLYFQFGSLIGWKGGNLASDGKGQGMPLAAWNGKYWNGAAAWSWAADAHVWPSNMAGTPAGWPVHTYSNQWYFGHISPPYATSGQNIREYSGYAVGSLSNLGIGDACSYYLGSAWRQPTLDDFQILRNSGWSGSGFKALNGSIGHYFGPSTGASLKSAIFFPASGHKEHLAGNFISVATVGLYGNSIISDNGSSYDLEFTSTGINPADPSNRTNGFSVRCAAEFVDTKAWIVPMAGASKTVNIFVPKGIAWSAAVVKGGTGLTLSGGSGTGAGSFTLTYPSAAAGTSRGAVVRVTSGSNTYNISVTQSEVAITAGDALWAKGNLIATGAQGPAGRGGCKIGEPRDNGLYFQFGGLIGWKGGTPANGGNGVGKSGQTGSTGYLHWGGAVAFSWENDAYVWPTEMDANRPTTWPSNDGKIEGDRTGLSDHHFNYNVAPYSSWGQSIREFNVSIAGDKGSGTLATGRYAKQGVGDPCTYYLGTPWRLPTAENQLALMGGKASSGWVPWATPEVTGRWVTAGQTFGGIPGTGAWFGPGLHAGAGTPDPTINPFFPSGGLRDDRGFINAPTNSGDGLYQSCSVYNAQYNYFSYYHAWYGVSPQSATMRKSSIVVRCVMDL